MKKLMVMMIAACVLTCGSLAIAALKDHYYLNFAYNSCEDAIKSLVKAKDGKEQFGGHRATAESLLRQAQKEIWKSVDYAEAHRKNKK